MVVEKWADERKEKTEASNEGAKTPRCRMILAQADRHAAGEKETAMPCDVSYYHTHVHPSVTNTAIAKSDRHTPPEYICPSPNPPPNPSLPHKACCSGNRLEKHTYTQKSHLHARSLTINSIHLTKASVEINTSL